MTDHDDHERRLRELERRADQIERDQMSEQEQADALETAVTRVATDLATAQHTLQVELDALAAANTGVDLSKLTTAVAALDPAVQALAALKPEASAPAEPTTESVSVSIDSIGTGSAQLDVTASRVSITAQPGSGTASLEAVEVEGQPNATKVLVVNATPESVQTVTVSIAAEVPAAE